MFWRGVMIVALFVTLQSLLIEQRGKLIEQEASYGHAILDNAWAISELMNETKNLSARLNAYSAGRASRAHVQLSFDLLWSRIDALVFAEQVRFDGLEKLKIDYRKSLAEHETAIFDEAELSDDRAMLIVDEFEELAKRTRQLWSVEFNQNRATFLGRVSGETKGTARDIDALIALLALAGLAYLGIELLVSNRALRREHALVLEARSASEMKSSFLANMSHEVRTPLGGVLGAADLLRETPLQPDQRQLVETLASSAEHLLGVVNQVLDLSKIEAGKVEIEDGIVDLNATGEAVIAMFRTPVAEKALALKLTLDPALPGLVRGDMLRLRQVLANLVSNAVKFTETGEIAVGMEATTSRNGDRRLVLRVRDTGVGIPHEAQARIFDAFSQSDVSDTRRFGGTGLGLTISRHLVELMGGSLTLTSRPGEGTEVRLDLPLRPVAPVAEPVQLERVRAARAFDQPLAQMTVLIVDDTATNRMLLSRMLSGMVARVIQAADGREAVEIWQKGGVDLILMDVQMPVMSGTEAAAQIRAQERASGLAPAPIYSISANAMPHQIRDYSGAGMDGHLSKPFRKVEIADIVSRHAPRPFLIAAE